MDKLVVGNPLANFHPDIEISIKVDSRSGQMQIASANGQQINPLVLASICCNIAKANVDATLQAQSQMATRKGMLPHQFLALDGEHRCRVPGCQKIKNDPIHVSIPAETSDATAKGVA